MNRRGRMVLFVPSAILLFGLFVWSMREMVPFGHYRGPYGNVVNGITEYERHVTDVVTAVNFDIRGLDTMMEESILFLSVIGVTMLLRKQRGESDSDLTGSADDEIREGTVPESSDAVRTITLGLVGPLVVFGFYIVLHGQLTPGGGFQGGVVLATAPLLVYLADDLKTFKRITNHSAVEIGEAAGIAGFVALGCLGLARGAMFLANVLPLGQTGSVFSGGTIPLLNICTGLAVAGGFVSVTYAFLEQTVERRLAGGESE